MKNAKYGNFKTGKIVFNKSLDDEVGQAAAKNTPYI